MQTPLRPDTKKKNGPEENCFSVDFSQSPVACSQKKYSAGVFHRTVTVMKCTAKNKVIVRYTPYDIIENFHGNIDK